MTAVATPHRWAALVVTAAALAGCHSLPALTPASPAEQRATSTACAELFPRGCFEVVHTIEVEVSLTGHRASVLGVSSGDAHRREVSSVLMTPEGMVLFEGRHRQGRTTVSRALPPLDRHGFGARMFDDVLLSLFSPAGAPTEVGRAADGSRVCRFGSGRRTVDVLLSQRGQAEVVQYDEEHAVLRTVRLSGPASPGFARSLDLTAPGAAGYTMALSLVRADQVPCD